MAGTKCTSQVTSAGQSTVTVLRWINNTGADLGGGCRGCAHPPPPPRGDLRFSNTTGILQKKTMCFIGVDNPGSAPATIRMSVFQT